MRVTELDTTSDVIIRLYKADPDIIITANLWDGTIDENYMNLCLPNDKFSKGKSITHNKECVAIYYKYNQNGREIDCMDLFHFSARKSDQFCYYNPVMNALFPKNAH